MSQNKQNELRYLLSHNDFSHGTGGAPNATGLPLLFVSAAQTVGPQEDKGILVFGK